MVNDLFDGTLTQQRGIGKLLHIPLRNDLVRRITKINLDYERAVLHTWNHIAQLTHTHLSSVPR